MSPRFRPHSDGYAWESLIVDGIRYDATFAFDRAAGRDVTVARIVDASGRTVWRGPVAPATPLVTILRGAGLLPDRVGAVTP